MAHAHDHQHEGDNYYIDQLCLVALAGAFGVVCLTMYFWQRSMLQRILAPQFFDFVLWSGIVLMVLVVLRAVTLVLAGRAVPVHVHDHAHEHGHDHSHDHNCGHEHHDHGHGHDCGHDHQHAPAAHSHSHDHDHDHEWAPWRYVVLLIPVMLFLLGLPAQGPKVRADRSVPLVVEVDVPQELLAADFAMLGTPGVQPILAFTTLLEPQPPKNEKEFMGIGFKELDSAAYDAASRQVYAGKWVKVIGQYAPTDNSHIFRLVRFRIQCCAADAIPLKVPMISKQSVADIDPGTWVEVKGRVEFQKMPNSTSYTTVLQVPSLAAITEGQPDTDPYIQ